MQEDYRILLNFLPVLGPLPTLRVFRKPRLPSESRPDQATACYSFAKGDNRDDRQFYWVKRESADGFTEYAAQPDENNDLTRWALFHALRDSVRRTLNETDYVLDDRGFLDEISLIMRRYQEGQEMLLLQPYLLRQTNQFGFLVDFHFQKKHGVPFSRRIMQLSLSLDRQFRRNLDCYIDRNDRIRTFLRERAAVFSDLRVPGANATVKLSQDPLSLPARRLRSKVYVFANNRDSRSQFTGLRDFGPLQPKAPCYLHSGL